MWQRSAMKKGAAERRSKIINKMRSFTYTHEQTHTGTHMKLIQKIESGGIKKN